MSAKRRWPIFAPAISAANVDGRAAKSNLRAKTSSRILRVHGQIIPASAQQLAEKEAEYNGKLDKAYREQSTRKMNFGAMTKREGDYEQELQRGGALWATAARRGMGVSSC